MLNGSADQSAVEWAMNAVEHDGVPEQVFDICRRETAPGYLDQWCRKIYSGDLPEPRGEPTGHQPVPARKIEQRLVRRSVEETQETFDENCQLTVRETHVPKSAADLSARVGISDLRTVVPERLPLHPHDNSGGHIDLDMPSGYLHQDYVESFCAFGTPLRIANSGGWLVRRRIPGTALFDAMGCYPLFCCLDWTGLSRDLDGLADDLVAVVVVADPLGDHTPELLGTAFDRVIPYKEHFVIETGRPLSSFVNKSHRLHAMRALKDVDVERCAEPLAHLDDWIRLWDLLSERHGIRGVRRFSRAAFERQLATPGMVMFRAANGTQTVGLDLWYAQGDCAQAHLAAFDAAGYALHASYATKWRAIEYFNTEVQWLNLGGAQTNDPDDGLVQFKRGWATGTRTAWLCERVLQPSRYRELAGGAGAGHDDYFPAYRRGEFA